MCIVERQARNTYRRNRRHHRERFEPRTISTKNEPITDERSLSNESRPNSKRTVTRSGHSNQQTKLSHKHMTRIRSNEHEVRQRLFTKIKSRVGNDESFRWCCVYFASWHFRRGNSSNIFSHKKCFEKVI